MVYVNTCLGVLIDHKLKWKQHVKMITSKLSKTIAIMNRTIYILDKTARLILYYSLFLPYMSYIVVKCGETPTHKNYIECMYLLQKKVVRIVCGVGYRKHTNELFSELRILKLIDIVKRHITRQNNTLNKYLQEPH